MTVEDYLASLDPQRRPVIDATRELVLDNLAPGFEEVLLFSMPSYVVPLERYPDTYNDKPLVYVSFAAQKNYNSLYLMCLYAHSDQEHDFQERWNGGKKLNMGKSCVRFKAMDDLDVPLLAEVIASNTVDDYVALYERTRAER